jgi:hypothetical protein
VLSNVKRVEYDKSARSQRVIGQRASAMMLQTERQNVMVGTLLSHSMRAEMRSFYQSVRSADYTAELSHHRQISWVPDGLFRPIDRSPLKFECLMHDSEYTKRFLWRQGGTQLILYYCVFEGLRSTVPSDGETQTAEGPGGSRAREEGRKKACEESDGRAAERIGPSRDHRAVGPGTGEGPEGWPVVKIPSEAELIELRTRVKVLSELGGGKVDAATWHHLFEAFSNALDVMNRQAELIAELQAEIKGLRSGDWTLQ